MVKKLIYLPFIALILTNNTAPAAALSQAEEMFLEYASNANPEYMIKFIAAGINVNVVDKNGNTAMHYAAIWFDDLEIMEKLITAKANVNATDTLNETPLHLAARKGYTEKVELLLKHGANPTIKAANYTKNGIWVLSRTPARMAAKSGYHDLAKLLREAEEKWLAEHTK
ncbi:ankyrin repeat domain-containing protein [Candidatus Babeliales bacterium]|nr:ankyrin repeat domain-containing protein [Candidatus Babeliales bacterium]